MSEGGSKRILLVDDDQNISRFLNEALRLHGYDVYSYDAAEPALEALGSERFDLALLDILLPGINGLQFCRQIRHLPSTRELPIIMMTAFYKQAEHIEEAREQYGATDYLLKPFPLKTLLEKIADLIGPIADAGNKDRLSVEGRLSETSLPQILHNLYSLRATGLLQLDQENIKKVIYIKNGYPIFVRSNVVKEFLGQMLVSSGAITAEDLELSLQRAKETGQRHGTTLIEMELLSAQQLNDLLKQQIVDKLLEIFSWPDGSYRFIQAREFKEGVTSIDISPANLIHQGLRDYASREQLQVLLSPWKNLYLQHAENPLYRYQEIQLNPNEQKIFAQCRGQLSLAEILNRFQLSRHEAEPLLATLLTTGILVGREEPEQVETENGCEEPPELREKRDEFLKQYAWMMQQDYFTLLGISESDSRDQIRKAYYGLVKQYHPDRFFEQNLLVDLKDKVNALFQRISDAHETLVDSKRRSRYVNDLKTGGEQKDEPDIGNILQAESAFQKGMALFRAKNYAAALKEFDLAVEFGPEEAEYLVYQAWSSHKAEPADKARMINARHNLLRAIDLNPRLANAHLYLGYLSKNEGKDKEARRRFERAIQYNPKCTEALRELRLMNLRSEKEREKKGILGIFRKEK